MMPIRFVPFVFTAALLLLSAPGGAAGRWDLNGDGAVNAADLSCAIKENAEDTRVCSQWPWQWPQPDWRTARDLGLFVHNLDQDGDGFSDGFEEDLAHTLPGWTNARHVVFAQHPLLQEPDSVLGYYLPLLDPLTTHRIYAIGNDAQDSFYNALEELESAIQTQDHLWVFIRGNGGISYNSQVGYYDDLFMALRPISAARKVVIITGCYDTSIHYSVADETDVMVLSGSMWQLFFDASQQDLLGGPDGMGNHDGYISLAEVYRFVFEHRLRHLENKGIYPQSLLDQIRADPESMIDDIVAKNLQVPLLWDPQGLAHRTYLGEWVGNY